MTKQRILAVARDLFSERGFERTTVREIARRVGISDPALYYYFKTKRIILEALMVQPDLGPPQPAPMSREQFVEHLHALYLNWAEHADTVRMLFREQLDSEPASREFRRQAIENFHAMVEPLLRALYGERAAVITSALQKLLSGILWDAVLTYGEQCPEVSQQEGFRTRTRRLIQIALPTALCADAMQETPS